MAFLGSSAYFLAVATADREINDKGIKTALLVASSLDPFWARAELTPAQKEQAQLQVEQQLQSFVNSPGADGVLDIVISDEDRRNYVVSASNSTRLVLALADPVQSDAADAAQVEIRQGRLQDSRVRSYGVQIHLEEQQVGLVRVFLSAAMIEKLESDLKNSATMLTLLALVVGIGVVMLAGSILTRPVRVLKNDMSIVARGDLQHQSTIRTGDELEQLAHAFNRMTANLAEARDLEASRKALERELSIATRIQEALLPDEVPDISGFELCPFYAPAKEVGGDYYDFIPLSEDRYGLVVADVSGKGIPGSLVMTMTRSLVRMASRGSDGPAGPAEVLERANANLSSDMTRGMFVTCIYGDFDARTGRLAIGRAGHNAAYVFRRQAGRLETVQPGGMALGMADGAIFDTVLKIQELTLDPGDFLVFYTDGIVEAMNDDNVEYSAERFEKVLVAARELSARDIVDTVIRDVRRHAAGADPSDDITLVILKRQVG